MKNIEAKNILSQLVQGVHPETGDQLPEGSVTELSKVIRALLCAISGMELAVARDSRRASLPRNIGKTWSPEEHAQLMEEHADKMAIEDIAEKHGRTVRSIEARLEKHGLIKKKDRKTQDRFGPNAS